MILTVIGLILLAIGAVCDLLGAIGMHRFNTFYLRLHAATVGTVGGKFYPLLGVAFIAAEQGLWPVVGISVLAALLVLVTTPVGSHALAYAASKAKIVEMELDEFRGRKMFELAAIFLLCAVALSYLIVTETDLLKAIAYSGVFGGLILLTLYVLMAPDVILAYVAISVGLSTGLMVFVVSKTTRHEVV